MRNSKLIVSAGIAVTAIVSMGVASAADLPARTYTKAPPMVEAVYDWSGFYIGGDIGGQWSDIGLSRPAGLGNSAGALSYGVHHDSFAAGGRAGVQKQWGQFVFGIEGSYVSAFDRSGDIATPSISIFTPGGAGTASARLRDTWTIGGRIGYAVNTWLLYATGGYANGSFAFDAASGGNTEHASARLDGYYIGGGVEYAVAQNWILGAEYRHYGFDAKAVTATVPELVRFAPTTEMVLGRLSYKFNWGGAVVAKY
jgi:outer membrane immunogenic protein